MVKEVKIILSNKLFYSLIITLVFVALGAGVYAYTSAVPNPGHGADGVWVTSNGTEKTLQEAIDGGDFGGSGGGVSFGDWVDMSSSNGVIQGPAETDGIVSASCTYLCGISGQTGISSSSLVSRITDESNSAGGHAAITMPVKKGEYWKVSSGSSTLIYWIPIVSGGGGSGGSSNWEDMTSDTNNFDVNCEYKYTQTDLSKTWYASYVSADSITMDYSAGNYVSVSSSNKASASGGIGSFSVNTYRRC